jgi:hypothetical protein
VAYQIATGSQPDSINTRKTRALTVFTTRCITAAINQPSNMPRSRTAGPSREQLDADVEYLHNNIVDEITGFDHRL